uniref:non-specific serine/threonine protein kinase n=1 Tax=Fagus sylvatica TaxID=28930 RepID=A0A2N9GI20_FAGSY
MKHSCLSSKWFFLIFYHGTLLMCRSSYSDSTTVPAFANETDRLALLDFKNGITQDPLQIMTSWNDSVHFCNWIGVTCNPSSKTVMVLDLEAKRLSGTIPPSIGNLTYLTGINLQNNSFFGEIPLEVGRLQRLQHLNLTWNSFGGKIPTNLSFCTQLRVLDVAYNHILGQIPDHLSSLSKLVYLNLAVNNLTGNIPAWIGNFSSLQALILGRNNLQGSIPSELGRLSSLEIFQLAMSNLSGTIPPQIYNISTINFFSVTQNRLHGSLPPDVGLTLPNLQIFYGNLNSFTGTIPLSLSNASQLSKFQLGNNGLTGTVPQNLASLQGLVNLNFGFNRLGNGKDGDLNFLKFLANCTSLEVLSLQGNYFGGVLPSSIANLSTQLNYLTLGINMIHGGIPIGIGNLVNLTLWIRKELFGRSSTRASWEASEFRELDLSENRLSGKIPTTFEACQSLEHLYLEGNSFEGEIPQSLENLRGLEDIDLSRNNLSGHIPEFLTKFSSLKHLNISYNDFEGKVPSKGIFANASEISIIGNDKLCGGVQELHLPACSKKNPRSSGKLLALKIVLPVTCMVIFALVLLHFFPIVKNSRARALTPPAFEDCQLRISYAELLKSTNGFSENNLIGLGSFGSVYKGVLSGNGAIVAVKVLNLQQQGASKSFINECDALRSIRHRNLLKIVSVCSSTDHEGNDFKSLIFEFMCNGSLDQWLHPKNNVQHQSKRLSFIQRLNIAIDVAHALEYLHHHCQTPIVHCDLKPSNILLDEDMVAHVGDFGLVKFLFEESNNSSKTKSLSVGLKGSIGYIPPEYGMGGQVSTLGDIYSYGILLLEMFSGKRPIDEMFKDGLSIHKFTAMALPEHVMDIIDPLMFFEDVVKINCLRKIKEKRKRSNT